MPIGPLYEKIKNLPKAFEEAMDDDFNTAFAVGLIYDLVRDINKFLAEADKKNEDAAYIVLSAAARILSGCEQDARHIPAQSR